MIEMMIVLSILVVLTGMVVINLEQMKSNRELNQFIQLLTSDLHFAQQYALSEGAQVKVKFNNGEKKYVIQSGPETKVKQVGYPEQVYFQKGTTDLTITYSSNGTIQKGGTLLLRLEKRTYKIVFHLGKGRFYIEQL